MKRLWSGTRALLVVNMMVLLASPAGGQGEQPPFSSGSQKSGPATPSSGAAEQRAKKIGAPQVIEIPLPEPPPPLPSPSWQENGTDHSSQGEPPAVPSSTTLFSRPGYLGVLYATAEHGSPGVSVLDVLKGSPAERAGFSSSQSSPRTEQVLKAAIIVLAFSPVGPLAIPLGIAHDAYYHQAPRGDLIAEMEEFFMAEQSMTDHLLMAIQTEEEGRVRTHLPKEKKPISEWTKLQGRFRHLHRPEHEPLLQALQEQVDRRWENLLILCGEKRAESKR